MGVGVPSYRIMFEYRVTLVENKLLKAISKIEGEKDAGGRRELIL
jgi:hypothetical protein